MSNRRRAYFCTFLLLISATNAPASADDEIAGVVLVVGDVDPAGIAEAANDAGGATWTVEELTAAPAESRQAPTEAIEAVEALYDAGDFPRCLTTLTDPALALTRLLGGGHGSEAARLLVAAAACTIGAEDRNRGKELFRRAFVLELEVDAALAEVRPDIAAVAEEARREVNATPRVRLTIDAPGTSISVDGRRRRCDRAPCVIQLHPGSHVIAFEALGRSQRVDQIDISEDLSIAPRLDSASPEVARGQLAAALAAGRDPETRTFSAAAANVYGVPALVIVNQRDGRIRASVYDRGLRQTVARQSAAAEPGAKAVLVRNVINEWRGEVETGTPWWVWAVVAGSVVLAGVAAFFLLKPEFTEYSFTFPAN